MKIIKEKNDISDNYIIRIFNNNKEFRIFLGGNFDLYWCLYTPKNNEKEVDFIITKENYYLYKLFEKLYFNIKEANIFDINNLYKQEDFEDIKDYYELEETYTKINKKAKNSEAYNLLYNNKVIRWISDFSIKDECNNEVILKKENDIFKIKFIFNDIFNRSIRFRNSRSRYDPFNVCFMDMYNKLQNYNPNYHQIHIEEYLYKKKILKR